MRLGRLAAMLSRRLGLGRGTVISGALALRAGTGLLTDLTGNRRVAIVTGTNGKTTTTSMTAQAVATRGPVATNREGANMASGLVAALIDAPQDCDAVLEVDEIYVPSLGRAVRPRVFGLLNLSREFTRGVSLGRTVNAWRNFLASVDWRCTVVANCDDPLVVWAVQSRSPSIDVVWVAGRLTWDGDVRLCPGCGQPLDVDVDGWRCRAGDLGRPTPAWSLVRDTVQGPEGRWVLDLAGSPSWLGLNALFALALAREMGVPLAAAAEAVQQVSDVGGRYRLFVRGDHDVRLFMVKNPASWSQALTLAHAPGQLVLVMEQFGIKDATPLWDLILDPVALDSVTVSGHRAADLAARLEASGVLFTVVPDPLDAIDAAPSGAVNVIVNFTALTDLRTRLIS